MSEGLDTNCQFPAYICGRIMAVFENLQRRSGDGEMNSSILNRYFGLASTYPAVAFPKIERFAQRHLQKLRKYKPATAYAIDKRLQELHNLLQPSVTGAFPGKLGLEDQGLFALGYYHQKARFRSEARDFEKTREAAKEFFSEYDDPEKN